MTKNEEKIKLRSKESEVSEMKDVIINPEEIDKEKLQKIADCVVNNEEKLFSFYDKLRKNIKDKMPSKKDSSSFSLIDFLFLLPDFFMLLTRVLADKRVDKKHKILLSCVIGYVVLPIDIIPDFIPVIGYIDDLVIVVLGLDLLLREIDHDIILSNWSGKVDLIETIAQMKSKLEKHLKAPFIKNTKALFRTFGIYNDKDPDTE
ncbi:MAG: YkvA family protein [Candidatus Cloacimonetes bacterium]|nr:YkvA family protein [Candidatus Cloacimonadota bacterium]